MNNSTKKRLEKLEQQKGENLAIVVLLPNGNYSWPGHAGEWTMEEIEQRLNPGGRSFVWNSHRPDPVLILDLPEFLNDEHKS